MTRQTTSNCTLAATLLWGMGCATISSSSSQEVSFSSDPAGADVLVDGVPVGKTPMVHSFDRDTFDRHVIMLRHPGYRSKEFPLRKSLNNVALFNCTSLLSWGTDALTGAMMEYAPDAYFVELEGGAAAPGTPPHLTAGPGGHADPDPALLQERRRRYFVLVTHRRLLVDIVRMDGEYLRALARLYAIDDAAYPAFVDTLRGRTMSLMRHEYPVHFYDELNAAILEGGEHGRAQLGS